MRKLDSIIERFVNVDVLTVGDVILDRYLQGEADRISPEAPVPVVRLREIVYRPGGAANVAANVAGLGGIGRLVGCVGEDEEAAILDELLESQGVADRELVTDADRPTTCKTRVIAERQQVVRIDWESQVAVAPDVEQRLLLAVEKRIGSADVVVLSDYGKGVGTTTFCTQLVAVARRDAKPVVVDPKGRDYTKYRGAAIVVPNQHEASVAAGREIDDDRSAADVGRLLRQRLQCQAVLITRGGAGVSVITQDGGEVHLPTLARQVFDVTGAGDTMVAVLSLAIGAGATLADAAAVANTAAGLAVERIGTAAVGREELVAALGRGGGE